MKAFVVSKAGDRAHLHIHEEMEMPEPRSGEIRIRICAVGLNPVDYKAADWGHMAWIYPHVLGVDGAGVVDKVGPNVDQFKVGDRVYGLFDLTLPGCFAEYVVTVAHTMALMPAKFSFEEMAAVPCAGWTAYQAFYYKLRMQPGQRILIHAGSGGVGSFSIQLAKLQGLKVITTCSQESAPYVRDLGADYVIDYRTENIFDRLMGYTNGKGVHAVIDTIGGPLINENFKLLAFGGSFVGLVDVPEIATAPMFEKALSVQMVFLGGAYTMGCLEDQKNLGHIGSEMAKMIEERKITPTLTEILPFEKIPEGLERLATHRVRGKLVARVADNIWS
ncbi:MAG: zinc-binding dehydrogenase [Pseudobdellovibrionaceae bacterium]